MLQWLEDCRKDMGLAIRQLRKARGFTAVVVLSLALGIGANTAIFTLIESALLRPIAVRHPDRLRLLTWHERRRGWVPPLIGSLSPTFGTIYEQRPTPDGGILHTDFTPRIYREFLRDRDVFESLFAFKELGRVSAVVDGNAEAVSCFLVSGDFYRGLEISPVIGRAIGVQDDVRTPEGSVAMISYQYWTRRFSRSSSVVGKKITLNEVPVTIIGVNPEYFTGIEPGANFEIWTPLNLPPAVYGRLHHGAEGMEFNGASEQSLLDDENAWLLPMMGRLKPGVSEREAASRLNALFQAQVDANPGPLARFLKEPSKRPELLLQSAARGVDYLTERYDRLLIALLSLAGLVLLIACANIANLLLAKSAMRQREISLRLALGAGRWRISRQLLAEGLLLAAVGGAVGVIFAYVSRNGIPALLSIPWRPGPFDAAFNPRVLAVSIGITFLTGVLFSLAPIRQSRRVAVNDALKEGSRATSSLSKLRMSRLLVAIQIAVCVVLLVGATLCVETFARLRNIPLGFRPQGLLLFSLDLPRVNYDAGRTIGLLNILQERLSAIPGVESASFTGSVGGTWLGPGDRKPVQTFGSYATSFAAGSRFFETMGIPILTGRAIDRHDQLNGPRVAVVNQEFVRHFFHGENPVGKTFRDLNDVVFEIVGVCADWRSERFRDPIRPGFYGAWVQSPQAGNVDFEIRIAGQGPAVVTRIRDLVRSIDPNLAVADVHTEEEQITNALSQERLMASLAAIFGGLALILASIGIYGVTGYAVVRRTNEIGIRVALGARSEQIGWMVLRETLLLSIVGIALGLPLVVAAGPLLNHFLAPGWRNTFAYGLNPNDPLLLALADLVLASVALGAGYVPARRAARIDPMSALRQD